jgi:hypothetical protein
VTATEPKPITAPSPVRRTAKGTGWCTCCRPPTPRTCVRHRRGDAVTAPGHGMRPQFEPEDGIVMLIVGVLSAVAILGLIWAAASVRVVQQYERGVVFRFGRVRPETRGPGLAVIAPPVRRAPRLASRSGRHSPPAGAVIRAP